LGNETKGGFRGGECPWSGARGGREGRWNLVFQKKREHPSRPFAWRRKKNGNGRAGWNPSPDVTCGGISLLKKREGVIVKLCGG